MRWIAVAIAQCCQMFCDPGEQKIHDPVFQALKFPEKACEQNHVTERRGMAIGAQDLLLVEYAEEGVAAVRSIA